MTKALGYVRVSSAEQETDNQAHQLEQLARARGLELETLREVESGKRDDRPVLRQVLRRAHAGEYQVLLIAALDRLGRTMTGVVNTLLELERAGVVVISARESWLDGSGPARPLLVSVFAWLADFEHQLIVERTKAGLARARRQGKRIGRPRVSPVLVNAACDAVERGVPVRQAARAAGVDPGTVRKYLRARRSGEKPSPSGSSPAPSGGAGLPPAPATGN